MNMFKLFLEVVLLLSLILAANIVQIDFRYDGMEDYRYNILYVTI